jgi:hypothetical protein
MKPRRTHNSNGVFHLQDGNEDNDLWIEQVVHSDKTVTLESVWEPTEEERRAIAEGANIRLIVWWTGGLPPTALETTTVPLGKPPDSPNGSSSHSR